LVYSYYNCVYVARKYAALILNNNCVIPELLELLSMHIACNYHEQAHFSIRHIKFFFKHMLPSWYVAAFI